LGYDVEIDIRLIDGQFFLGHDEGQYKIDIDWLVQRKDNLWIHCKDIKSLYELKKSESLNYFYHISDDVTITSKEFFWTYPGKELTPNSIAVLPEWKKFDGIQNCLGICSDFIENYKSTYGNQSSLL
jgi:hypothetical protein